MDDLELAEQNYELQKYKCSVGALVAEDISRLGINPNDVVALDSYFECMPPQKEEFYYYYQDYLHNLPKQNVDSIKIPSGQLELEAPASNQQKTHSDSPYLDKELKIWQGLKIQKKKPSTVQAYLQQTNLFMKIVTEFNNGKVPRTHELNREIIQHYKDTFVRIPAYVKTPDAKISDIVKMTGRRKSPVTVQKTFVCIGTFLKWIEKKGCEVDKKLRGILLLDTEVTNSDKKKRVPFDDVDLEKLFMSKEYTVKPFGRSCDYWAPLIALFTGATVGEIVQLYVSDIKPVEGTYVIDINDEMDKQLKVTDGRSRLIPIHSQLIQLEFLEFVEFQKSLGETKLFSDEKRNDLSNLYTSYPKRFRYFRDNVGAGPRDKMEFRDFHSFRHLVRTRLDDAGVESGLIDDIIGHSSRDRSIGKKIYSHADLIRLKKRALTKLKYDLDFTKIARWKRCAFAKKK